MSSEKLRVAGVREGEGERGEGERERERGERESVRGGRKEMKVEGNVGV